MHTWEARNDTVYIIQWAYIGSKACDINKTHLEESGLVMGGENTGRLTWNKKKIFKIDTLKSEVNGIDG